MPRNNGREPVRHTCPDIDKLIDGLEKLRSANDALRTWGNEEVNRVDELESELEAAKSDRDDAIDAKKTAELEREDYRTEVLQLRARVLELEEQLEHARTFINS